MKETASSPVRKWPKLSIYYDKKVTKENAMIVPTDKETVFVREQPCRASVFGVA